MDIKECLTESWNLTLRNIVPLIFMTLIMALLSMLTLGILAPVMMAGYMQAILLMTRQGREPAIGDLFSQMRLFLPLFLFGLAVFLLVMIGFMLLFLPGVLISFGLAYCCLYMLPLMTDKGLGLVEAIKESYAMARRTPVGEHVVIIILFVGISALGGVVMFGTLFTQPLATVFLLLAYSRKAGQAAVDPAGPQTSPSTPPPPPPPPPSESD